MWIVQSEGRVTAQTRHAPFSFVYLCVLLNHILGSASPVDIALVYVAGCVGIDIEPAAPVLALVVRDLGVLNQAPGPAAARHDRTRITQSFLVLHSVSSSRASAASNEAHTVATVRCAFAVRRVPGHSSGASLPGNQSAPQKPRRIFGHHTVSVLVPYGPSQNNTGSLDVWL